jgi:hypothetical protein
MYNPQPPVVVRLSATTVFVSVALLLRRNKPQPAVLEITLYRATRGTAIGA